MAYYQFLGKKNNFYKFNANCSSDEKVGSGPGSCGGNIPSEKNILFSYKDGNKITTIVKKKDSNEKIVYDLSKKTSKVTKLSDSTLNTYIRKSLLNEIKGEKIDNKQLSELINKTNTISSSDDNTSKKDTGQKQPATKVSEIDQTSNMQNKLFDTLAPKFEKIMNSGDATCPGASYALARAFQSNNIKAKIVGGEFDGSPHYWVEVPTKDGTYIADIGNNILEETLESGKIKNIFTKKDSEIGKLYSNRDEEYDNLREFLDTHQDPFSKPSLRIAIANLR